MTNVVLLGSTGSIGTQTLDVLRTLPEFRLLGLAGGLQTDLIAQQVQAFNPTHVVQGNPHTGARPTAAELVELATLPDADIIVIATNGHDAIRATIAALQAGKIVALANKEAIVCAGDLIMPLAELGTNLRPIDSEHSAIWQSVQSGSAQELRRIILTASGGPFRTWNVEEMATVTPAQALKHPNWDMGAKLTIDSATLMNKGLELIEAVRLFDIAVEQVEVVVQPESYIHSMVEFADRSIIAQMSPPDMRLPIQYALTWPHHAPSAFAPTDFTKAFGIGFEPPREDAFPCLPLARAAIQRGQTYPTVLSAADEVAVSAFRQERIGFLDIPAVIQATMDRHLSSDVEHLDVVIETDHWARETATELISQFRRP